jgi:hypothetical protein
LPGVLLLPVLGPGVMVLLLVQVLVLLLVLLVLMLVLLSPGIQQSVCLTQPGPLSAPLPQYCLAGHLLSQQWGCECPELGLLLLLLAL